jgi:nucleotide-binding universal stress UspA family protein
VVERTTVLAPLDGSRLAEAALPYAEAVVKAIGAPLCLLGVIEHVTDSAPGATAALAAPVRDARDQANAGQVEQYLETTATLLRAGTAVSTVIERGDPSERILAVAEENGAGMVVMATHSRVGIERLRLGSVAEKVLRAATRPVLLVHPPHLERAWRPVTFHHLLVPLDGSGPAEAALPAALALAGPDTTVTLARVEPSLPRKAALDAEKYLQRVRSAFPDGRRLDTAVLAGAPVEALLAFAEQKQVDLIVMTTRGRGGLRRMMLGSTAERIARSGVPALVVPPAPARGHGAAQDAARV